jgi:hypothetical protein
MVEQAVGLCSVWAPFTDRARIDHRGVTVAFDHRLARVLSEDEVHAQIRDVAWRADGTTLLQSE